MKKNIIAAAAFAVSFALLQACNNSSTTKETTSDTTANMEGMNHGNNGDAMAAHNQMMAKMESDMNAVKMSGDFDVDFANMMIPHHQGAVDMAEQYIPKAIDEKIKLMAQKIINEQKKEIEQLRTIIENHNPAQKKAEHSAAGHGAEGHNELMDIMNKMMSDMKNMQMTGNPDKDFVMMMIPHHQSAIDMSENEISHGKNVEIKKFAQKFIDDQSKEIKEFEAWLSSK